MAVGWLPYAEAVTIQADPTDSWLFRAYLVKHEGRWLRYKDESERRTPYSSPALYAVKLWAKDAIEIAKVRAWDRAEALPGEDYYATMNRIAYDLTTAPDYPLCDELDNLWRELCHQNN